MPPAKKPRSSSSPSPATVRRQAERTMTRIEKGLDEAQDALRALGKDLGRGSKDLYKDTEQFLRAARRDAAKANRAARRDLEKLVGKRSTGAPRRTSAKRGSAAKRGGAAKRRAR